MSLFDPELHALFREDPDLLETAALLTESRPQTDLDPRFSAVLRAQLMREAQTVLQPRPRQFRLRFGLPAWSFGAVGGLAVAAAVAIFALNPLRNAAPSFAWTSPISGNSHVDPNQAITVSFNQSMNEQSVVASLHIQPATAYQTSWTGNTLTILPIHHLVANVPYVVTINHTTAMSASGQALPTDVTLSFGTAPSPSPSPTPSKATTPSLSPTQIGPADGDVVAFAPNGSLVANGSPSAQTSPTASAGSTSSAPTRDGLYLYPSSGGSVYLAPRAQAAAVSPDGKHVVVALDAGDGTSTVEVVRTDGTHTTALTTSDAAVVAVAWQSNSVIEFATASNVSTVDFTKSVTPVATVTDGNTIIALSLDGKYAALAATSKNSSGELLQISGGETRSLTGSTNRIAFSADGRFVSWIDRSGATPAIKISPTGQDSPSVVALESPGTAADGPLAINYDGSVVAFEAGDGSGRLSIASADNGTLLAAADGSVSALTFDRSDSHLAYITTGANPMLNVATIPQASTESVPASDIPPSALTAIGDLLTAEVAGNQAAVHSLAPSAKPSAAAHNFNRSYVLDSTLNDDGTVTCHAILVSDSKGAASATATSETITASADSSGTYTVKTYAFTGTQPWLAGPHLVGLTTSRNGTVLTLTFDSDLNPETVKVAVAVLDSGGAQLPVSTRYNVETREVTVAILGPSPAHAKLTVATSLADIDGHHLAASYSYSLTG